MIPSLWFPWRDRRPPFIYPVAIPLRTVVFSPVFRKSIRVLYVDPQSPDAVAQVTQFRPAVLAGQSDTLLEIQAELEVLPTHGIVVFTKEGTLCVSEADRDALWDAYRVPAFEEVITADGRLVAWECEAHDGLHITAGALAGPLGAVEDSACSCGIAGPRAIDPRIAPSFTGLQAPPLLPLPVRLGSGSRPLAM